MSTTNETVEAVFDKLSGEGEEAATETAPAVETQTASEPVAPEAAEAAPEAEPKKAAESTEKPRDKSGKFTKSTRAAKPAAATQTAPAAETAPAEPKPEAEAEEAKPEEEKPAATASKPPPGWRPAAKEHWAKLPAEVQAEVNRRETEIKTALNQSSADRKLAADFAKTIEPFRPLIAASSGDPLKSVANLMQTAAALQLGAPGQKLAVVESILDGFNVPVDEAFVAKLIGKRNMSIERLDSLLAGEGAATPAPQAQAPQQTLDPRAIIAQVEQALTQKFQSQRERETYERERQSVDAFASSAEFLEPNEFGPDGKPIEAEPGSVRDLMAQEIEMDMRLGERKRARGEPHVAMTLEQAYTRACQRHPEVSGILRQREAAKAAGTAQAATQRAKAAASSVRTQPAGERVSPQPKDTRSAVEAAWETLEGRT